MRTLSYFFFPIVLGFSLHQAIRLTREMPDGWDRLADYVIGVQGTAPVFAMFLKMLGFSNKQIFEAILAFEIAFLMVGIGVSGGWWVDALMKREK
jgi:uncharacterized membrane protein AbrB (regulator of aidB expression)